MTDLPTPPDDHHRVRPPQNPTKGFVHVEMVDDSADADADADADVDVVADADREWDLGLLLTVASGGRLFHDVTPDSLADLCALIGHLTGHAVLTVHLDDGCKAARDHVREHLACWPHVAPVVDGDDAMSREDLLAWLEVMRERYGAGQKVPAMPVCEWQPPSALALLGEVFRTNAAAVAAARAEEARARPELEPEWPMRAVLQVATVRMMPTADDFPALHELLCHLANVTMIMVAPFTAVMAVREHVRGELPWLEAAEATMPPVDQDQTAWLAEVEREHGTHVRIAPSALPHPHIGPGLGDAQTILDWVAGHPEDC